MKFPKLPTWAWITIGVVILAIVVALAWGPISRRIALARKVAECKDLQKSIAVMRTQGGDAAAAGRAEVLLRECMREAKEMGDTTLDETAINISLCAAITEQIAQEWPHYRSTSYDDPVKREMTRNNILRLGSELARCYLTSIEQIGDAKGLREIRKDLGAAIGDSTARMNCYGADMAGCGRFGVNEPHGNDKARDERQRVKAPLVEALKTLDAKLLTIDPTATEGAERAERVRSAGETIGTRILGILT